MGREVSVGKRGYARIITRQSETRRGGGGRKMCGRQVAHTRVAGDVNRAGRRENHQARVASLERRQPPAHHLVRCNALLLKRYFTLLLCFFCSLFLSPFLGAPQSDHLTPQIEANSTTTTTLRSDPISQPEIAERDPAASHRLAHEPCAFSAASIDIDIVQLRFEL